MDDKKERSGAEYAAESCNDDIPVDAALEDNADPAPPSGNPVTEQSEPPPYNRPGVGGRTTPQRFDEGWQPGEGTEAMGSQPAPSGRTMAAPDVEQPQEAVEPDAETSQERFADAMKASLSERGVEIRQLESQLPGLQDDARRVLQQQLDRLYALQEEAQSRLGKLADTGAETWQAVQESAEKAYDDLRQTLEGTVARFVGGKGKD